MRLYKVKDYNLFKSDILRTEVYHITPNDYYLVNIITKQGYAYVATNEDFDNDVIFDIDFQKEYIGFTDLTDIGIQIKTNLRDEQIDNILNETL